ncbi:MAG: TonB-dependent receptor [Gammaproteobacteria bacterium]|nr:TonB-dependent receptor [Gammaproteobacteria bacterium]
MLPKTCPAALAALLAGACSAPGAAETAPPIADILVTANRDAPAPDAGGDTAALLDAHPGVSLYTGGGASALPVIHGLNDERVNVLVNGMRTTSACANHMNPALSYLPANQVGGIEVLAGVAPVSLGGDSLGGTIAVDSPALRYAEGDAPLVSGALAGGYRSVSDSLRGSLEALLATKVASLEYTGSIERAHSYDDGRGDRVRDTLFKTENHAFAFGMKQGTHSFTLRAAHQSIPYQGFVNQYMDMVGNESNSVNGEYAGAFGWGELEARAYWQEVGHEMGFFTHEKTGTMPMETYGVDVGYSLKAQLPIAERHVLRLGHEYHRFTLEDKWAPVPGSMMMGPNTFVNINDGERDRYALFAEAESKWNAQWTTLLGLRLDAVETDAGRVQAYSPAAMVGGMMMGMPNPDAAAATAFNARDRSRSDANFDLTAQLSYEPGATARYELAYARKSRAPNLYERYAWGLGTMAMTMNGWFGDLNGYVGDPDLQPETAHTVSASFRWHDAARRRWLLDVTPYYTRVEDYIDVDTIGTYHPLGNLGVTLGLLRFANHGAELHGLDVAGQLKLWNDARYGEGRLKTTLGYVDGERTDGGNLYHQMPVDTKLALEQRLGAFRNAFEVRIVGAKDDVDTRRSELATDAYTLMNVRTSYTWQKLTVDFSITNLADEFYRLPLGGVDYADWKANGGVGGLYGVPGPGRSFNVGLGLKF